MWRISVAGLLMLGLLTATASMSAAEVLLIGGGKGVCSIVTGRDDGMETVQTRFPDGLTKDVPANVLKESAEDLAAHLNRMGGIWNPNAMVKVVSDTARAETKYRVLLGSAAIEQYGLRQEADKLSYVGYIYRTIGNDLLIFGGSSKGTANGIYGFLQDELGVRWFGSGPEDVFTVVPEKTLVQLGSLDKKVEPSFYGSPGEALREEAGGLWGMRMRKGGNYAPFINASHNFNRIFPPAQYFAKHPEYYAMRGGMRRLDEPRSWNWGLCYSNPEVVEIAARAARDYFRGNKYHNSFSLGINDCGAHCGCPECAKLQPERYYAGGRVASDMYYYFVNEVARRVAKEFPDRYIGAIAYNDVTAAPLCKMEKNVFVVLANDISEYFDAGYRGREEALARSWEAKRIPLGMYYYLQNLAKLVPAHFPQHLASQLKSKYYEGFRILFHETNYCPGPMAYVDARLWWDVNLDVNKLQDEYFSALYGPAAKYMKELYALFEEIHMRPRKGGFLYEHYKLLQFRPYGADDLEKMKRLLVEANKAVKGMGVGYSGRERPEERRLAYTSNCLKVFLDMLEGVALARELERTAEKLDDVEIMARLDKIERINAILNRNDALYRETLVLDIYQPSRYRADTCAPVRNEWKNYLSSAVGNALVEMFRAAHPTGARIDARAAKRLDGEVARYSGDERHAAMFRYWTGELKPGENKVLNPSFELAATDKAYPPSDVASKLDWKGSNAQGWAYWQAVGGAGSFTASDKASNSGNRAGVMKGIGGSGCFITLTPEVKEGEIYHAQAFVKNTAHTAREDKPAVALKVAWLDKNNNWTQQGQESSVQTSELDRWVKLEQVVQVPPNAAAAVILLDASNLQGEEEVFVDDISFRPLR